MTEDASRTVHYVHRRCFAARQRVARRIAFFLCLVCLPHLSWATSASWDQVTTRYFRHLSVPKDLPSAVTAIAQDKRGFIWLGTQDGLVRWDGYRGKLFTHDPDDPTSLPSNLVTGLLISETGEIIVATGNGGVARYSSDTEKFDRLPSTPTGAGIYSAFATDNSGAIWLGNGNGLSRLPQGAKYWENVELPSQARVWSLLRTRDGTLWAGTTIGLLLQSANSKKFVKADETSNGSALAHVAIRSLTETSDGELWFGTNDGRIGVRSADGHIRQMEVPAGHPILSLTEEEPGIICAGTSGTGLIFIDHASGKVIQTAKFDASRLSGLSDDFIYRLYRDKTGGLWVGNGHGADYAPPLDGSIKSLLRSERANNGLSGSHISAISMLPNGDILVGSESGGDLITDMAGTASVIHEDIPGKALLPAALINSLATTKDGTTWIATNQGLYELRNGRLQRSKLIEDEPVRVLLADDNILWIGLDRRGLLRFDLTTRALTAYQHDRVDPTSIADNFVLGLLRDPQHGLWIATNRGLSLFDGRKFRSFIHDPADPTSLPADIAVSLQLDQWQRLWIGTFGGGLAVLDGDPLGQHRFLHIDRSNGLPSNNIAAMLIGADGNVWASTDVGVVKVAPKTLTVQPITEAEGLAVVAYIGNSALRLADGTLLFGGVGGITIVNSDPIPPKIIIPEVVPTSIHIGQRSVPPAGNITLTPADHSLQVEFSALDFTAPERNHYAYKLEGFDSDWITTDSDHRLAAYTNIPPGIYSLLLRGANKAGIWSAPKSLTVNVRPAWYQTIWFKILLALMVAAGIVGLVRSRTALLRRRQKELEGQVAERTAEISSLLNNSGEGFLSFGVDFIVDRQYSRACELFLGEPPAGKNAVALLYSESPRQASFAAETIPTALSSTDQSKRELFLSLLPKEIDRRGKRLRVQYAVLENGHLMVVLRDITTERRLAERIASEHRRLGLIVAAITNNRDFFDALQDIRDFLSFGAGLAGEQSARATLLATYRQAHTFKGVFNQLSFERLPQVLHQLEEKLDSLRRNDQEIECADIDALIGSAGLEEALDKDLAVIRNALGKAFLTRGGQVTMSPEQAADLKKIVQLWRAEGKIDIDQPTIQKLLEQIERLGSVSLKTELSRYDQTIAQLALRLDKEVAPLTMIGTEDIWIDPDRYGGFLRSLVHIFRNCVAHGIEPPESRVENGKDEFGHISCEIRRENDILHLTISDDGRGIDFAELRKTLVDRGLHLASEVNSIPDEALAEYIFRDQISTMREADEWSGRGIGLAVVKEQIEKLGGRVTVETETGRGTRFIFRVNLSSVSAYCAA